jgi:hypothetical protein
MFLIKKTAPAISGQKRTALAFLSIQPELSNWRTKRSARSGGR